MAPKKREDERSLSGLKVLAPCSLWPGYPPPKGASGFEGKVGKRKDSNHHFVTFPDDAAKYFFPNSEIRKWLVEGDSSNGQPAAPVPITKRKQQPTAAAAAAAAAAGTAPPQKRKEAAAAAAGPPEGQLSKKAKAAAAPAPASSPRKVPKTPVKPAAAPEAMSKGQLRDAIDAAMDLLDVRGLQRVYKTILNAKSEDV